MRTFSSGVYGTAAIGFSFSSETNPVLSDIFVHAGPRLQFVSADMIMRFFRAYYDEDGLLVYELRRIARNYLFSRYFILDLIASFPTVVS